MSSTSRPEQTCSAHIRFLLLLASFVCVALAGCVSVPSGTERRQAADDLAAQHNWQPLSIDAGAFILRAYVPRNLLKGNTLTIYIEGDGFAWATPNDVSDDPTPIHPTGLQLALADPGHQAVYLARPCQYAALPSQTCSSQYWTSARFAPQVIKASNQAIDQLKARYHASQLVLVGYSGGGAVATLVAASRHDILKLITVAGNLDHRAWTRYHRISPLSDSLNPADYAHQLANLPQVHFIGADDRNITLDLAQQWPPGLVGQNGRNLHVVPDFNHNCCWAQAWSELISQSK